MKKGILVLALIASLLASSAWASRETVSCAGKGKFKGYAAKLDFEAETALETVWAKNEIHTYVLGKTDSAKTNPPTTTAKVSFTVPSTAWKKPYSGTFPFTDFYEVNVLQKAGGDFGSTFKTDKPYRSFHGHDKDQRWDTMIYFGDDAIGKTADKFPALATIQADLMDQGYYFIELVCSSKVAK
jgi:hypothetical protein